jgi:hypothetical protein
VAHGIDPSPDDCDDRVHGWLIWQPGRAHGAGRVCADRDDRHDHDQHPAATSPADHREFIRTLDHFCKVGNNLSDKKFGGDITVYDTAESMDAYARLIERADRFNDKFNRKNNFFGLDPVLEKDQRNYAKYRELSRRLDNYTARVIRTARHHEFEELLRLFALDKKTRNQRTKVTADMGLRFCGA